MKIKQNMGMPDKGLRLVIAFAIITLYATDIINGETAIVLLILSAVFIFTSLISFCPLYLPFNINTTRKKSE